MSVDDVNTKTNQCWHGCSGKEAPVEMASDVGIVSLAEIWDNIVGRQWVCQAGVLQVCE